MLPILYLLAIAALLVGTAAIYMAMIEAFPIEWLYVHYRVRKPIVWALFLGSTAWIAWQTAQTGAFPWGALPALALMGLAIPLAYKMHQENAFPAVDFPAMSDDPLALPLADEMEVAVVEYGGETRAYPLDYVIHHHIINDRFGDRIVALTYCAMCRSIIPFDVTDLGPLFVASFKHANMIVADRRTHTWFQQSTCQSVLGPLHPQELSMLPFQILSWGDVKKLDPLPKVAYITQKDLRQFELPIPGIWSKIMAGEATPGLPAAARDRRFPARTRVVGITEPGAPIESFYLKEDLLKQGVTYNKARDLFLVACSNTVNAFRGRIGEAVLHLQLQPDHTICDEASGTVWNLRGKFLRGEIHSDLAPVRISDEYWFSWRRFHPDSDLVRV